jgi:hypothetical protein
MGQSTVCENCRHMYYYPTWIVPARCLSDVAPTNDWVHGRKFCADINIGGRCPYFGERPAPEPRYEPKPKTFEDTIDQRNALLDWLKDGWVDFYRFITGRWI